MPENRNMYKPRSREHSRKAVAVPSSPNLSPSPAKDKYQMLSAVSSGQLLKAVGRRIKRALLDLESRSGDLLDALCYSPAVRGFERDGFENQQIERSLNEIGRLCHKPKLSTNVDALGIISSACRAERRAIENPLRTISQPILSSPTWPVPHCKDASRSPDASTVADGLALADAPGFLSLPASRGDNGRIAKWEALSTC